ncbi:hypothetical protein [Paenibacillus polymyxa]|uniref:hypothetical protein n=1 Tax=Paenibacillus polymyxa TaxID=1406 RepID=UPI0006C5A92F|nr:hypothetical protein [Paenibacillus polymyxa]KOS04271.1 hypothetical protein AM598_01850 [Paenibacillus polymyxa]
MYFQSISNDQENEGSLVNSQLAEVTIQPNTVGEVKVPFDRNFNFYGLTIQPNTVGEVKVPFDRNFNFYGFKVKNDKKKVFCVGEDMDPSTLEFIFRMYNTEGDPQNVEPIRKRIL